METTSSTPFFSILVPVYNVEKYIRECIESLINQTYDDYEIILVDDGSTDRSGKICDKYTIKYKNIKTIHQNNMGLLMARRTGIKAAIGQYFIFVDSDDFVEKNLLVRLKEIIEKYRADMVIFQLDYYDGVSYRPFRNNLYNESTLVLGDKKTDYYKATLLHTISNGMCGKAVSRKIVDIDKDYSKFNHVILGEDLLQSLPYITSANRIYFLNEILYHYRINPDSVAHDFESNRYESLRSIEKELLVYSKKWKLKNLENYLAYHALNETVWGSLRVLSKSNIHLNSEVAETLFYRMKNDKFMIHYYKIINKRMLNIPQRITLFILFRGSRIQLKMILLFYRIVENLKKFQMLIKLEIIKMKRDNEWI